MNRTIQMLLLFAVTSVPIFCAEPVHLNNDARYQEKLDAILNSKPPPDSKSGKPLYDWLWKLSGAYMDMRRYYDMEVVDKTLVAMYPSNYATHSNLSVAYGKQGKYDLAIEEAKVAALLCTGDTMHPDIVLCSWLYLSGQKEEALKKFAGIETPTDEKRRSFYYGCKVCFYSSVGDVAIIKDSMIEALKLDKDNLSFFERDITLDKYRNEQWFIDLVGKTLADK